MPKVIWYGHMVCYESGVGASPNPLVHRPKQSFNSNKFKSPIWLSNTHGWAGSPGPAKYLTCPSRGRGFDPRGLHPFYTLEGCHVAAHDWATWHHTTCQKMTRVSNLIHPPVCHIACPVSMPTHLPSLYGRTDCTVSCHINTVRTVRTVQSTKFCLFGKMNRTRYLTHTTSV
jgi:hypothetical protein